MFEHIVKAPADPILGLAELFNSDERVDKINLGIGVYKTDDGLTPILNSVKKAEYLLLQNEVSKNYLNIEGIHLFAQQTQKLLFGENNILLKDNRIKTVQAPGGTGALKIAADFLKHNTTASRVWISDPSWPNHKALFSTAGFDIQFYQYYDPISHGLNFDGMLKSLKNAKKGDIIVLHGCCHNPTGLDLNKEQWQHLAKLSAEQGWLPIIDFAYQGFAQGLEEDAEGLRIFAETHQELIVANSYSKNFGLYNERVGACTLLASCSKDADNAFSQMKIAIRTNYSNPPSHGAAIVATILNDSTLSELWQQELAEMRDRIANMRSLFVTTLKEKGIQQDFSFINHQNGMFSFSGLTKEQVLRLRSEFGIYAVDSGRINIAGITTKNINALCSAIASVLSK